MIMLLTDPTTVRNELEYFLSKYPSEVPILLLLEIKTEKPFRFPIGHQDHAMEIYKRKYNSGKNSYVIPIERIYSDLLLEVLYESFSYSFSYICYLLKHFIKETGSVELKELDKSSIKFKLCKKDYKNFMHHADSDFKFFKIFKKLKDVYNHKSHIDLDLNTCVDMYRCLYKKHLTHILRNFFSSDLYRLIKRENFLKNNNDN